MAAIKLWLFGSKVSHVNDPVTMVIRVAVFVGCTWTKGVCHGGNKCEQRFEMTKEINVWAYKMVRVISEFCHDTIWIKTLYWLKASHWGWGKMATIWQMIFFIKCILWMTMLIPVSVLTSAARLLLISVQWFFLVHDISNHWKLDCLLNNLCRLTMT